MEIVEVENLTMTGNVVSTDVCLAGATAAFATQEGSTSQTYKSTQTPGHVFLGPLGEVIITNNYIGIELVVNQEAVEKLTNPAAGVDSIKDTVMTSLARLDWHGERILEKAMTSHRLSLTEDLMPRLLKELAHVFKTEEEKHKVQQLVKELFENHLAKLFGFAVGSLIFILEHSSVDDAVLTLDSTERQEELQRIFLGFLPKWVAPLAVWTVSSYTLSPQDRAHNFGYTNLMEASFSATFDQPSPTTSTQTHSEGRVDEGPSRQLGLAEQVRAKTAVEEPQQASTSYESLVEEGSEPSPPAMETHTASKPPSPPAMETHTECKSPSLPDNVCEPPSPPARRTHTACKPPYEPSPPAMETHIASKPPSSMDLSGPESLSRPPQSQEAGHTDVSGPAVQAEDAPLMKDDGDATTSAAAAQFLTEQGALHLDNIDIDDIPKQEVDFRFVLLGKTGSGKSSTANTILGQDLFPASASIDSVTKECQVLTASRDGAVIEVLDSPGFFNTVATGEEVSSQVMNALLHMMDRPDALLYVINIGIRYTEEEHAVFNLLKALLGDEVVHYIVIIFTHSDLLQGKDFSEILASDCLATLRTVLEECGNRYVLFDNTAANKRPQVDLLLDQVQQMKQQNQGCRYRYPRYSEKLKEIDQELEERLIKAEQQRLKDKAYIQTLSAQLSQIKESIEWQDEEFARQEKEAEESLETRKQAMNDEIVYLAAALKEQGIDEEERQKQIQNLQDNLAMGEQQYWKEMEERRLKHDQEMKKQCEEKDDIMRTLTTKKLEAETFIKQTQLEEMARAKMEVARRRPQKQDACCLM